MPTNFVAKLAKEHNISVEKAEERWNVAKQQAAKQGKAENFAYITSIFKNMMGESASFMGLKDFMMLSERDEQTYDRAPTGDRDEFEFGSTDTEELDDISDEDFDEDDSELEPPELDDEDFDDISDEDFDEDDSELEPPELDDEDFDDISDEDFDEDDSELESPSEDEFRKTQRFASNENYKPLSLLKDLLSEGKKNKKLKRAAKSVYHRDYLKTKNRTYRKYHKDNQVNEGMWDYVKGAGQETSDKVKRISQPFRDIHAAGQRSSLQGELTRVTQKLAKVIAKYRQIKSQLAQTNESIYEGKFEYDKKTGQMGYKKHNEESDRYGLHIDGKLKRTVYGKSAADNLKKRDPKFKDAIIKKLDEGMWDYIKGAGQETADKAKQISQPFRDIHAAGQRSSLQSDLRKYQEMSVGLFDKMTRLITKLGTESKKVVDSALKNTPNGIKLAIYKKLKQMEQDKDRPSEFGPGIQAKYSPKIPQSRY